MQPESRPNKNEIIGQCKSYSFLSNSIPQLDYTITVIHDISTKQLLNFKVMASHSTKQLLNFKVMASHLRLTL